ncbi:Spy/CpxP family protein refolding chaperone [Ferrimonas lipolytica]|uniref:Spheroplast protein y n=1 Tax=Ferrimonas lipolytica TaxID=2724191 RepID=A0A6H1UH21_9GAMM|nr:Spy/CpxP family protein refolding chaperone [Ferrimonas lipolytica]QIZ78118.1 spheroplast protein y [Ferrimonas lipolytica]
MKRSTKMGLAALVMITSATAFADHHGERSGPQGDRHHAEKRGGHGNIHKMLFNLDLTDEQRDQVKALLKAAKQPKDERPSAEERQAKREAKRAAMQELMNADSFDETAAKAIIAERQQRQTERELQQMKTHYELMQILTQEQRDELAAKQQERMERRQSRK